MTSETKEEICVCGHGEGDHSILHCFIDGCDCMTFCPDDPDFVSEAICQKCGGFNPVWFAPNDEWNVVYGGDDTDTHWHIVCPICLYQRRNGEGN